MDKLQGKIFLIEPIDFSHYKALIVYSDTSANARLSANQKFHQFNIENDDINVGEKSIYFNQNLSRCIEINPKIILIDDRNNLLKIEYEGVLYELIKNKPKEHIGNGLI